MEGGGENIALKAGIAEALWSTGEYIVRESRRY
jgi:hypothetical protein